MERTVAKFTGHAAADRATREYYRSLTPQQRIEILLEPIDQARPNNDASGERLERVYRVVKFSQRG
jgi:hypothetical protein